MRPSEDELRSGLPVPERRPRLAGNATWRFASTLVRVGIGVVSVSLFTRILGISQWGLLALFQAAIAPLAFLEGFGAAAVKYTAEALGRRDATGAVVVVQTTVAFNATVGTIAVTALFVVAPWLATTVFAIPAADLRTATAGFRLIGPFWLSALLTSTYSGVLAAHQRYDTIARLNAISLLLSAGAGVLAAASTGSIVAVLAAQAAVSAGMAWAFFRRAAELLPGLRSRPRADRAAFLRSFAFWRWAIVAALGGLLTGWADRYVLGAFFAPAVVGFYSLAHTLYAQLYGAFLEMAEVLFPAVSHMEGRGELRAARRLTLLAAWALATGFGICAAVLGVVGGDFLYLWISPEAAAAATFTLRVLCAAGVVSLATAAPFFYLTGLGKTRWDAVTAVLMGAAVLGVGLVLVPRHGLPAVGWGLLVAGLLRWLISGFIWKVHFRQEYRLASFALHVWVPPLVSVAMLVAFALLHDALGRAVTWPWLFVETAVALVVVAAIQLGLSEILPGGPQRRRDVAASFKPIVASALRRFS